MIPDEYLQPFCISDWHLTGAGSLPENQNAPLGHRRDIFFMFSRQMLLLSKKFLKRFLKGDAMRTEDE